MKKYEFVSKSEEEGDVSWFEYERHFEITIHDPDASSADWPNTRFVSARFIRSVEREHAYIKGYKPYTEPVSAERPEALEQFNIRALERYVAKEEAVRLGFVTREQAEYDGD